jgi:hypothetical protein
VIVGGQETEREYQLDQDMSLEGINDQNSKANNTLDEINFPGSTKLKQHKGSFVKSRDIHN